MTYPEAIRYLESFINLEEIPRWSYKASLNLERSKNFLATVDNPQDRLLCIHVAGSKGKGSTCAFITYILREAGFKVGLYTSPHLSDFRERIRILDPALPSGGRRGEFEGMISKYALSCLVKRLRSAIEKYNRICPYGPLSFFEIYTALAFVYFNEKKVDFAVLETGLGGRLDATNVVNAAVSVITPISYEHTEKLGDTLAEIAGEKAGIIKPPAAYRIPHTAIVISAPQEKEAAAVIREKCRQVRARLFEAGRDIVCKRVLGRRARIKGIFIEYKNLTVRLTGEHQLVNACVAIGAVEALRYHGVKVGVESIRRGLYNTLWPGRCEIVSRKPLVVLDGAQNAASAKVLKETIARNFKYKKLILVLGISGDKDILGICRQLCPRADSVVLTQAHNPRAADVNDIARIILSEFPDRSRQVRKIRSVRHAIREVLREAKKEDLIVVTGSLFVVGEAREIFLKEGRYGAKKKF